MFYVERPYQCVRRKVLVDRQRFSLPEMVSHQLGGEIFQVRCRRKALRIAVPRIYHWLLRSYFSRESMMIEKMIG